MVLVDAKVKCFVAFYNSSYTTQRINLPNSFVVLMGVISDVSEREEKYLTLLC